MVQNKKKLIKPSENQIEDVTPEVIAELFCELDSSEQARFFNTVADLASTWSRGGLEMQLQYITDEDGLTLAGRRVMQSIGGYSHWGLTDDVEKLIAKK